MPYNFIHGLRILHPLQDRTVTKKRQKQKQKNSTRHKIERLLSKKQWVGVPLGVNILRPSLTLPVTVTLTPLVTDTVSPFMTFQDGHILAKMKFPVFSLCYKIFPCVIFT